MPFPLQQDAKLCCIMSEIVNAHVCKSVLGAAWRAIGALALS